MIFNNDIKLHYIILYDFTEILKNVYTIYMRIQLKNIITVTSYSYLVRRLRKLRNHIIAENHFNNCFVQ